MRVVVRYKCLAGPASAGVGQRGLEYISKRENKGDFGKAQRGEKVTPSPCGSSLWEGL